MDPHATTQLPTAAEALERLSAGNERFRSGQSRSLAYSPAQLAEMTAGQQPFVTVLGCSDSRVPPEWIFDAGLGELFVIRVAGNVVSAEIAGSLQYAGQHLRTPLFVVLGHEGCGAVAAALATKQENVQHHRHIQALVNSIVPALREGDFAEDPAERLTQAVEANVRFTVRQIVNTPEGQARVAEGQMKIVGAMYELATGRVRFL